MDVRVIKQKGSISYQLVHTEYQNGKYIGYRRSDEVEVFPYTHILEYDGYKLYLGSDRLVEPITGFCAVKSYNLTGKPTIVKYVEKFKELVKRSGVPFSQVIARTLQENLDLETWLVSCLII